MNADETRARLNSPGGWGQWGRATEHERYARLVHLEKGERRRRCRCGCAGLATHAGCANGVALTSGCEMYVRRWVRDGYRR